MGQQILSPAGGTYIYQSEATTTHHTEDFYRIGEHRSASSAIARCLIRFDLSSLTSIVNSISSATLKLVMVNSGNSNYTRNLHAYRLLRDWTYTQATWNIAKTGTNWGTAGAGNTSTDYNNTSLGYVSVAQGAAAGTVYNIAIDVATVKSLINGTYSNYGFILRVATETDDQFAFASMIHATESYRPTLTIVYPFIPSPIWI